MLPNGGGKIPAYSILFKSLIMSWLSVCAGITNAGAQISCGDLELVAGDPVQLDCYQVRVPVYFHYTGTVPIPSTFSACGIELKGAVTDAKLVDMVLESGFDYSAITGNGASFTITSPDEAEDPTVFHLDDAGPADPHFYLIFEVAPNSYFEFEIEYDANFAIGTALNECTTYSCMTAIDIPAPIEGVEVFSYGDLGSPKFVIYIDEGDTDYDAENNVMTVPVKIRNDGPGAVTSITLDRLDFAIDVADVFGNLEFDIPNGFYTFNF